MAIVDYCDIVGSMRGFLQIQFFAYVSGYVASYIFYFVFFPQIPNMSLLFIYDHRERKTDTFPLEMFYKKIHFSPIPNHKYAVKSWKDKRLLRKRYRSIAETFVNLKNKKGNRKLHLLKLDRKQMAIVDYCDIVGSMRGFLQIEFFANVSVMLQVTFSNVVFSADSEYVLTFYIRPPRTKYRHISVGDFYKKIHFSPIPNHKYAVKSWKDKRLLRKRYRSIAETFVNLKNKKGNRKLHLPKWDRKQMAIVDYCDIVGSMRGFLQIQFFAYVSVMLQVTFSILFLFRRFRICPYFLYTTTENDIPTHFRWRFLQKKNFSPIPNHKYAVKSWKDKRLLRKRYRSIAETFVKT